MKVDPLDLIGLLMLLIPVIGLGLSLELLKIEALILGYLAYGQLRSPLCPSPRPRLALALIGLSFALTLAAALSGQAHSLFDALALLIPLGIAFGEWGRIRQAKSPRPI
ncbi:hypothetical protein [Thermoflexus hugenholtzii]